jgi:hypothetical protein
VQFNSSALERRQWPYAFTEGFVGRFSESSEGIKASGNCKTNALKADPGAAKQTRYVSSLAHFDSPPACSTLAEPQPSSFLSW